ncbi:unnamed protein product [Heterotrigona itama]|uniref:Scavenger receptor class B member 1 n=1 Tax=Heterotrigona itama TaxID=395501 RepID=A0A6V7HJN4_9HYME|nr:unnamed protein product [Heterotrigona itama]
MVICAGAAVAIGALMIIVAAILAAVFPKLVDVLLNREIALRDGGRTFNWWREPPVSPRLSIYIYNVTNADEFLNDGEKPALQEVGPYVYLQHWEKVDELSVGPEEDLVVVPNVPMLSATSQSKHAARFLRLAMASIMDILRIKPFVEVSIGQLLWGYEDPLLKLAKDVVPKEQKLPYEQFGLLYGKNGTMPDWFTVYTGQRDIGKYGMMDKWNGKSNLGHWTAPECDAVAGSDGSIFPPPITKHTVLKVFDKDLCRALPLVFKEEVITAGGVPGYRFVPAEDAFASPDRLESQRCFCPAGPPCAPEGTFNASLCQYDSPVLLSFPHFYLGDPTLRDAVTGISPPIEDKHQFYIDVQPMMGASLRAKARIQINLAVSQVRDIKQVASFPDIVFPILWFEDVTNCRCSFLFRPDDQGIDELPEEMRGLMKMAVEMPPIARAAISGTLAAIGAIVLLGALLCLARAAKRQEKLHLTNPLPSNNVTASKTAGGQLNPAFQNSSGSK